MKENKSIASQEKEELLFHSKNKATQWAIMILLKWLYLALFQIDVFFPIMQKFKPAAKMAGKCFLEKWEGDF